MDCCSNPANGFHGQSIKICLAGEDSVLALKVLLRLRLFKNPWNQYYGYLKSITDDF